MERLIHTNEGTSLIKFIKKDLNFEEMIFIFNMWETDRDNDNEEYIFNLSDENDYFQWKTLYGNYTAKRCSEIGQFWLGGTNYYANVVDRSSAVTNGIIKVSEKDVWNLIENVVVDDIEDIFLDYLIKSLYKSYKNKTRKDIYIECIENFSKRYRGLIDFDSYTKSAFNEYNNLTTINYKYKWTASSDDGAFTDKSEKLFDTEKECYEDMRNSALEKMKWNTQYDEDFGTDTDYIGYEVTFAKTWIAHKSYSGVYTYKIEKVEENSN